MHLNTVTLIWDFIFILYSQCRHCCLYKVASWMSLACVSRTLLYSLRKRSFRPFIDLLILNFLWEIILLFLFLTHCLICFVFDCYTYIWNKFTSHFSCAFTKIRATEGVPAEHPCHFGSLSSVTDINVWWTQIRMIWTVKIHCASHR